MKPSIAITYKAGWQVQVQSYYYAPAVTFQTSVLLSELPRWAAAGFTFKLDESSKGLEALLAPSANKAGWN